MKPFDDLLTRARRDPRHIVLPEGKGPRVVGGAIRAAREGIARITFLGRAERVREPSRKRDGRSRSAVMTVPETPPDLDRLPGEHHGRRRHKDMDAAKAREPLRQPLYSGALMVRRSCAEGSVAGAAASTAADTAGPALLVIGTGPRRSLVSSLFVMILCEPCHDDLKGAMAFADRGLAVEPSAEELAQIAIAPAESARALLSAEPRVAMLSFSTNGSGRHPLVDEVVTATRLARNERPDLLIGGDVRLDAGIVPEISTRKVPSLSMQGQAAAKAIGPVLKGPAPSATGLSRGCSVDDAFPLVGVAAAQAHNAAPAQP